MKRSEKPSSHNWRFIFSEKECLIVLININRPNQVSVLQCSTDVVRDYTSRSSEHGGGTPGAHHPPAWYVSCQLNFRRFVWLPVKILATCHSDRISSNDSRRRLFLFSHKKGAIIQGRRLFQILPTGSQINWSVPNLVPSLIFRAWIVTDQTMTRANYSREAILLSISLKGGDYLRRRGTAIIRRNTVTPSRASIVNNKNTKFVK